MNKIYLNEELKLYYSDSTEKEIALMNIPIELHQPLRSINNSENIRTLFSQKAQKKYGIGQLYSYLNIAYTLQIESTLLEEIIPALENEYRLKREIEFKYSIIQPYKQEIREITEHNKGSEWLTNPEYFFINQIKFELQKGDAQDHDKFWEGLTKRLSKL